MTEWLTLAWLILAMLMTSWPLHSVLCWRDHEHQPANLQWDRAAGTAGQWSSTIVRSAKWCAQEAMAASRSRPSTWQEGKEKRQERWREEASPEGYEATATTNAALQLSLPEKQAGWNACTDQMLLWILWVWPNGFYRDLVQQWPSIHHY